MTIEMISLCSVFEWGSGIYTTGGETIAAFDWGKPGTSAVGRVLIVHDYDGARVACAEIGPETYTKGSFGLASLNTYPSYDDEFVPAGSVALSIVGTTAYITYDLM